MTIYITTTLGSSGINSSFEVEKPNTAEYVKELVGANPTAATPSNENKGSKNNEFITNFFNKFFLCTEKSLNLNGLGAQLADVAIANDSIKQLVAGFTPEDFGKITEVARSL